MAASFLTPDELITANTWLKTIFFPAVKDADYGECIAPASLYSDWQRRNAMSYVSDACKKLYNLIVSLTWDTNDDLYNSPIATLRGYRYYTPDGAEYKLTEAFLCKILAHMCAKADILWDDSQHSSQELDYFKKTRFGKALWDFYCFVSQDPNDSKIKISTNTASSTPRSAGTGTSGAGHTLFRSNCGGLVNPNQNKVSNISSNGRVYWIGGEFVKGGKTQPRLHVSPQDATGPLTVKYNSGQGYNDCVLFFGDLSEAQKFYSQAVSNQPATVKSLQIKQVSEDSNGYVEVSTQFGNAFIKASKLHEDLEEDRNFDDIETKDLSVEEAWEALSNFMK